MEFETNNPNGTGVSTNDILSRISETIDETDAGVQDFSEAEEVVDAVDEQPETDSETDETTNEVVEQVEPDEDETPSAFNDETLLDFNGEQVSVKELKNGYMRQQDYTVKTQETARLNRELEATRYGLNDKVLSEIDKVKIELAYEFHYNQPNWEWLSENDAFEYAKQKQLWEKRDAIVKQVSEFEAAQRKAKEEHEQRVFKENQVKARDEMVQKYPEFGTAETAKPILKGMAKLLTDAGFSKEEIEGVADSRILDIVYRLNKFEQANAQSAEAKKVLSSVPKVSPPKPTQNTNRGASNKNKSPLEQIRDML